jgi:dienelactone hydrolase
MRALILLALVAALVPVGAAHAAVRVAVTPSAVLVDAPVDVRVTGLAPRETVTLRATTKDYLGYLWRRQRTARADAHGVYDTHGDMHLFWSLHCLSPIADYFLAPALAPTDVQIDVLRSGRVAGRAVLSRRGAAAGVTWTDTTVGRDGVVGTYFAPPPGSPPAPAVMVIGGSEGSYTYYPAALLASHGCPAFAVAYFKEPSLPAGLENIPLEYFQTALRWLAVQPGVDPKRLVVLGTSRGGEGALLIGSAFPDLVHGVIAVVPSDQVNPGYPDGSFPAWTLGGKPVPSGPIPVEKIAGPVLALGGGKDEVWDSSGAVKRIVDRANEHGRTDVVGVVYAQAGHGLSWLANMPPFEVGQLGGTAEGNEKAQTASWARTLSFLAALGK